jgi:hypothetical protein
MRPPGLVDAPPSGLNAASAGDGICQAPIVYRPRDAPRLAVHEADGVCCSLAGDTLDAERSAILFQRTGRIQRIDAWVRTGG